MKIEPALLISYGLRSYGRIKRVYVMVVALFIGLAWVGAVIAQPSPVKPLLVCDKWSELPYSDLQSRESMIEKSSDVVGPITGDGIDATKFSQDGGSKLSASGGMANLFPITPNKVSAKTGSQNSSADAIEIGEKKIDHYWGWIWTIMALIPVLFQLFESPSKSPMTHNANITDAQRPR